MTNMSTHVESTRWANALRTQAKTTEAPPTDAMLCPYCNHEGRIFQSIDQLFNHVNADHASHFQRVDPDRIRDQLQQDVLRK